MHQTHPRPFPAGQHHAAPRRFVFGLRPAFRLPLVAALVAASGFAAAAVAHAQDTFKPPPPVTYTEKYEVYGGINYANGQAGQNLPKRYNAAGGEIMGTWYVVPRWGAAADVRWSGGTSPVLPGGQATRPIVQTRPYVSQFSYMGGVQYRLTGNQHASINLHALGGATTGDFDHSNPGLPPDVFFNATGLYTNRTAGTGVVGGSIDFNRSARWAIRVAPDLVFEHYGTELREFVYVSAGIIYRFGHR